uniref:Neuromedin-S n=1 Tax=Zosterops lateralis melanops TaxID=1220523 RepID=A0A8D2P7B3_ZOSLA
MRRIRRNNFQTFRSAPLEPGRAPWHPNTAVPRPAGFPQPFSRHRDGVELPPNEQLALCFSEWMEMSDQPQMSSTVLDLCYSIFNSMHKNEVSLFHKIHSAPGHMLKRPIYLWRLSPLLFQNRSRSFKTIIESILKCISISLLASVFNLL